MRFYIFCILFVLSLPVKAQNYLDSLVNSRGVCYLSLAQLGTFGVKEIKIYTFLTPDDIVRLPLKKEIRSKAILYKYDIPGRLKEEVKSYTGLDSIGVNRIGEKEDVLINGMIYYYNTEGKISSTLSYGAGVNPNSEYIYDHEGQLVMIRYYFEKVMHRFSESAGRTIYDYYPQNGKIKYKIKLNNNGVIEKSEYFIYDNVWDLKGISNSPETNSGIHPYKPYVELGKVAPWQISVNNIPMNNFLYNNKIKNCNFVLIQVASEDYYLFGL
jgi:hypothetical protein